MPTTNSGRSSLSDPGARKHNETHCAVPAMVVDDDEDDDEDPPAIAAGTKPAPLVAIRDAPSATWVVRFVRFERAIARPPFVSEGARALGSRQESRAT